MASLAQSFADLVTTPDVAPWDVAHASASLMTQNFSTRIEMYGMFKHLHKLLVIGVTVVVKCCYCCKQTCRYAIIVRGWRMYAGIVVCARTQRTGAAARESLR